MSRRPVCTILAGPNGSGKTSLFEFLMPPGEQVNADRVAKMLAAVDPSTANRAAGVAVIKRLRELIAGGHDFNYETTLSSQQSLNLMQAAKNHDYAIALNFVALPSPKLNIARVKQRVARGGHDIPVADIIRRYDKAFENLPQAISLADEVRIYDNRSQKFELVFALKGSMVQSVHLKAADPMHQRIRGIIRQAHELRSTADHDGTTLGQTFTPRPPK